MGVEANVILDAAAFGMTGEWTVSAVDLSGEAAGDRFFDVHLDRSTVAPGQTVHLTVALRKTPPGKTGTVGLVSTYGDQVRLWPLTVNVR